MEILIAIVVLVFLIVVYETYSETKIRATLRSRGYTIISTRSGYDTYYRFDYNGFDKNLRPISTQGPIMPSFNDAVANANAHFHAKILHLQSD